MSLTSAQRAALVEDFNAEQFAPLDLSAFPNLNEWTQHVSGTLVSRAHTLVPVTGYSIRCRHARAISSGTFALQLMSRGTGTILLFQREDCCNVSSVSPALWPDKAAFPRSASPCRSLWNRSEEVRE